AHVVLMSAQGALFDQAAAQRLAQLPHLVIVCGHYEGVDERVIESEVDEELSIGDFVLTGGELAAMVVIDAVTRLVPDVIEAASLAHESHTEGLLEGPHYTRPVEHEGRRVPAVLLSGDHAAIARWPRAEAVRRTAARRHGRGGLEDAGRGTDDSGARAALRRVARDDLGSTEEGETLVTARLPLLRECPNHSYERPLEHACPRAVEGRSARDPARRHRARERARR